MMKQIFFCFIIFFTTQTFSADYKWQRMSGKWEIKNSRLTEKKAYTSPWNYYELLNMNSIVSMESLKNFDVMEFDFKIHDRFESPAEFWVSFAVRSPEKKWFYHMYSIRLSGGFWWLGDAHLLYCDRKDKTKKLRTKRNTSIKKLKSESCWFRYGKKYHGKIKFQGKRVSFYIDGEKVLSGELPCEDHSGRIALSTKNTRVTIDKILVKNGNEVVFQDDFNSDTIYVRKLKASVTRVPKKKLDKKTPKK